MSDFTETAATILWVVFLLALVFLWQGEPSLWSRLHEAAVAYLNSKGACPR